MKRRRCLLATFFFLFALLIEVSLSFQPKKDEFLEEPQVVFSTAHTTMKAKNNLEAVLSHTKQAKDEERIRNKVGDAPRRSKRLQKRLEERRLAEEQAANIYTPTSPPEVIPDGGNFVASIGVTLVDRNSTDSIIHYTTDGSTPTRATSTYVKSGGIISMESSGKVRALIRSSGNDSSLDSEVTISSRFTVQDGKIGKALLAPYHNGPDFSGRFAVVDLATDQLSTVRIHEVLTDFGDFYSELGRGPYAEQARSYDLTAFDPDLKGFWGAVYAAVDGTSYGFLVPNFNGREVFGKVVRIDLEAFWDAKNTSTVSICAAGDAGFPNGCAIAVLDLTEVHTYLRGFAGGFAHGGYVYLVPAADGRESSTPVAHLARVRAGQFNASGVEWLELSEYDTHVGGYYGGLVYGDSGYLVPHRTNIGPIGGIHSRYTADGYKPAPAHLPRLEAGGGHLEAEYSGAVLRLNLTAFSVDAVEHLDLADLHPDLRGFAGGFVVGKYGYLVPYKNQERLEGGHHGNLVKLDLETFELVQWLDLTELDPDLKGFVGGFAYGKYGFLVPHANDNTEAGCLGRAQHGKVVRVDLDAFSLEGTLPLDLTRIWRQQVPGQAMDTLCGFVHGLAIGNYGYLLPHFNGLRNGKMVRMDMRDYESLALLQAAGESTEVVIATDGVQVCDLALGAEGDPLAVGFAGGLAYYKHSTWGGLGTSNIS